VRASPEPASKAQASPVPKLPAQTDRHSTVQEQEPREQALRGRQALRTDQPQQHRALAPAAALPDATAARQTDRLPPVRT
jgi:hypothetical protein